MRKYALFIREGDDSNFEFPQMCGEEMEQTYIRMSDWYCHADDVRFALDAKDREIAELREKYISVVDKYDYAADMITSLSDRIHEKDAILHHSAVAATAARNRINDLEDRLKAITASSSPVTDEDG